MVRIPASRTAVPALPAWFVPRPALWRSLPAAGSAGPAPLVAVIAPAGSGKTVLLAEWARRGADGVTAWAALDREDGDPERFWSVVLAAVLATGAVPPDSPLHGLPAGGSDLADGLLDGLAGLAGLDVPLRLVLDDVHVLADRQPGVRALARLVRHRPRGVELVLAGRSDPDVGLPRLRREGGLRELRAEGLRFSMDEAAALTAASGVPLAADGVATLHRRTEGWAAGLRLAVLALRRCGPGSEEARALLDGFSGDDRTVADYLVGELLAGLAADDRELLDDLSVCRRLPVGLAIALTGRADVARRLEELAHGLGMVERVDRPETGGEHRLHVLLRSHLSCDLARRHPERHRSRHAAAARWWADQADPAHAMRHAERAEDPALTAELLGRLAVPLLLRGELPTLRRALGALDPELLRADPRLSLAAVLVHLEAREHPAAAARLGLAREVWPATPGPDLVALRDTAELLGGGPGTDGGVEDGIEGGPDTGVDPGLAGLRHVARGTARLAACSPGDAAAARADLHRGLAPARTGGFPHLEAAAFAGLALAALVEGDPGGVPGPGEAALAAARRVPVSDIPARTARTTALLAWSDLLRGEPGHAAERCRAALGTGDLAPADAYALRAVDAAAVGDLGDRAGGLAAARAARAVLGDAPLPAPVASALALLEHRAAVLLGNLRAAGEVAAWLAARAGATGESTLLRAWAEAATGRWDAARSAVDRLRRRGRVPPTVLVEAGLVDAEAGLRAGDPDRGGAALDAALGVGRDHDVVRPFTLAGPRTRALLLERAPTTGFAVRVAGACAAATVEPAPPLSERELVVLALLPSLLDAPTMAEELVVSVNTVKSQIRSIYAKLGVSTRRGAVSRAVERGLLV